MMRSEREKGVVSSWVLWTVFSISIMMLRTIPCSAQCTLPTIPLMETEGRPGVLKYCRTRVVNTIILAPDNVVDQVLEQWTEALPIPFELVRSTNGVGSHFLDLDVSSRPTATAFTEFDGDVIYHDCHGLAPQVVTFRTESFACHFNDEKPWLWSEGSGETIEADKYSFRSVLTHEIGHGIGIGHISSTGVCSSSASACSSVVNYPTMTSCEGDLTCFGCGYMLGFSILKSLTLSEANWISAWYNCGGDITNSCENITPVSTSVASARKNGDVLTVEFDVCPDRIVDWIVEDSNNRRIAFGAIQYNEQRCDIQLSGEYIPNTIWLSNIRTGETIGPISVINWTQPFDSGTLLRIRPNPIVSGGHIDGFVGSLSEIANVECMMEVVSITGRLVLKEKVIVNRGSFSTRRTRSFVSLPPGLYIVSVDGSGNGRFNSKLVIR